MADRRSPDRAASKSSGRESAARPCAMRSCRSPAAAPAAGAVETERSLRRPATPATYRSSGRTAPRPGCSRESCRWYSYDAGVPPASVDVVGSQKPPSVTPNLPLLLLPLFTHAQRPPHSGFVLTAHPESVGINRHVVGDERALRERRTANPSWPRVLRIPSKTSSRRLRLR